MAGIYSLKMQIHLVETKLGDHEALATPGRMTVSRKSMGPRNYTA